MCLQGPNSGSAQCAAQSALTAVQLEATGWHEYGAGRCGDPVTGGWGGGSRLGSRIVLLMMCARPPCSDMVRVCVLVCVDTCTCVCSSNAQACVGEDDATRSGSGTPVGVSHAAPRAQEFVCWRGRGQPKSTWGGVCLWWASRMRLLAFLAGRGSCALCTLVGQCRVAHNNHLCERTAEHAAARAVHCAALPH